MPLGSARTPSLLRARAARAPSPGAGTEQGQGSGFLLPRDDYQSPSQPWEGAWKL